MPIANLYLPGWGVNLELGPHLFMDKRLIPAKTVLIDPNSQDGSWNQSDRVKKKVILGM